MKTCDEMVHSLLERREQYAATQKKKKRVLMSTIASLCVVAMVGVALWQGSNWMVQPPVTPDDATMTQNSTTQTASATKPTYNILWADSDNNDLEGHRNYFGKELCCMCLCEPLGNDSPTDKIAIRAELAPFTDEDFVYKGKTLSEYREAYDQEGYLFQKLSQLVKEGDILKYGDVLYLTGSPDGERWSKELYEKTVAYYGEELLSKYIVDGEFLKAEVEAEVERRLNGYHPARDAEEEAINAFKVYAKEKLIKELKQAKMDYEIQPETGYVVFFATAEEFAALSFEGSDGCWFHWASNGRIWCDFE